MKARIKKTGEIVNLASYAKITLDQCDSWGNPIEIKPEEVELIQEQTVEEHWQDVRERAAIAAMQSLIRERYDTSSCYSIAIDELKKIHAIDEGKAEMDYCFTKMMNGEKASPAWSEEDERLFSEIMLRCKKYGHQEQIDWLKSLKQRIGG